MRTFNFEHAYFYLIAVFLIWSQNVAAQVTNGDFESGLTGWNQVNAVGSTNYIHNTSPSGNVSLTAGASNQSTWIYRTINLDPCRKYTISFDYLTAATTLNSNRNVIAIGSTVPTASTTWSGSFEMYNTLQTSSTWASVNGTIEYFPKNSGNLYIGFRSSVTNNTASIDNIQLIDAGPSTQCRGCDCPDCAASSGLFASWTAANSGSGGCTSVTRTSNGLDETFCSTWTMPSAPPATQNVGFFHLLNFTPSSCQNGTATREIFASCGSPLSSAGNDSDGRPYWTLDAGATYSVCITRTSTGGCTSVSNPCTRPYLANVPMPVTLGRFNAVKNEHINILNWTTHSEQNNEGFEVQSSSNGIDFHTIGFVKGHNNSNEEINYEFTDVKPNEKITYYRLKQIDFDGTFEYSPVIVVRSSFKGEFTILNSITSQSLNLLFPDDNEAGKQIDILTANGQRVREHYVKDHKELSFDVSDLTTGIYFLRVRQEDGSIQTQRWIKSSKLAKITYVRSFVI